MKSVRRVLAAVVAGLLLLAGCSNPGAGVAATVNGVDIAASRIENAVRAIGATPGQLAEPHAIVLTLAIRGEVAREIASEQGIQLTGAPRTTMLAGNANLARYADVPDAGDFVTDVVDSNLVTDRLGEDGFLAKLAAAQIQVNPRYGSWSVQAGAVNQAGGQLSQPWATPTAPAR
ncbi:MAG: hypothetical protein QM711_05905 [Micropruina sp.]|uniref:hypothetical protein n=1 Tax=Micropruina sp. TaxID=2737536 RepID=UPI0039E4D886